MEAESKINAKIVGCGLINNFAASRLWDGSTYACRVVAGLAPSALSIPRPNHLAERNALAIALSISLPIFVLTLR